MFLIRQMQHSDLAAVIRLQDSCYHDELYEAPEVVLQRFMRHPQSCWVAVYKDKLWGYLFTYPSKVGNVNPLGAEFPQYANADCLYLHDVAVSRDARGQGVATSLVTQAAQHAKELGLQRLALVAVQNSVEFWQQQGFVKFLPVTAEITQALATYQGSIAHYLTAEL
jgi:ribosomal protein S18 acetylase RimI-like enzyme